MMMRRVLSDDDVSMLVGIVAGGGCPGCDFDTRYWEGVPVPHASLCGPRRRAVRLYLDALASQGLMRTAQEDAPRRDTGRGTE